MPRRLIKEDETYQTTAKQKMLKEVSQRLLLTASRHSCLLVTLSEEISRVITKLGAVSPMPLVTGTNLMRLSSSERGVELLATRRMAVIFLRHGALGLRICAADLGESAATLHIGMEATEVRQLLGTDYEEALLADPSVRYAFYPAVGLAVRYDVAGKVSELAVARVTVSK